MGSVSLVPGLLPINARRTAIGTLASATRPPNVTENVLLVPGLPQTNARKTVTGILKATGKLDQGINPNIAIALTS